MSRHIIITHEFFPYPAGVAVYVCEMALALARAGEDVEVWCPPNAELAKRVWPFKITAAAGDSQGWLSRLATMRLWQRRAADVREATVWFAEPGAVLTACYGLFLGLPAPKRLLVTLHGSDILNFTRNRHRRSLLVRLLVRADVVSVVSVFTRELLLARLGVPLREVRVISGALRTDFAETAKPVARPPQFGAELVVLSVARIHPRKGQLNLLQAGAALPDELRGRTLFKFVGRVVRPQYRAQLENFAREHAVRVEFVGEQDGAQLAGHYAGSTVFAMTSLFMANSFESFGMVYLEAGAFGLPVLAHNNGGVSEAVIDGETGLLVSHDAPDELAGALRRLLESPELRRRLGEGGHRHALGSSWDRNAALLIAPEMRPGPSAG